MLIAGLLAHRPNGFFVFRDGYEYVLLLAAVSLALAILGPGKLSVDYTVGITMTGWSGGGIALGVAVVAVAGMLAAFWRPQPDKAETADEPAGCRTDVPSSGLRLSESAGDLHAYSLISPPRTLRRRTSAVAGR
jgi:putative oxidoreductase